MSAPLPPKLGKVYRFNEQEFTQLELETLIRVTRAARDTVQVRKFELQERELVHGDGHVREAILACENQAWVMTTVVAKLWQVMNG